MVRIRTYLSGIVQGVGMRYYVSRLANRFDITGYVKNLPDGRVEIIAEGPENQIRTFLERIKKTPVGSIDNIETEWEPYKNEFTEFEVRF